MFLVCDYYLEGINLLLCRAVCTKDFLKHVTGEGGCVACIVVEWTGHV